MKLKKPKCAFDSLMDDLSWFRHNCPNGADDVKRLKKENKELRERIRILEKKVKFRT